MGFDLIITARDTTEHIDNFVKHLRLQEFTGEMRVLFADQCTSWKDPLSNSVTRDRNVRIEALSIDRSSLSHARNVAISLGLRNDIVAFPDDDCWYDKQLLASVATAFAKDPSMDVLCTNVFDPICRKSYGNRPLRPKEIRVRSYNVFSLPISVGIFVRRDAFEEVGPWFDEQLGAGTAFGSGEETELIARLLISGKKVVYRGDISVFHLVPSYGASDVAKYKSYGLGFGYLATRLLMSGQYGVAWEIACVLVKSLAGYLLYWRKPTTKRVYLSRISGVIGGILHAVRNKRSHASCK